MLQSSFGLNTLIHVDRTNVFLMFFFQYDFVRLKYYYYVVEISLKRN